MRRVSSPPPAGQTASTTPFKPNSTRLATILRPRLSGLAETPITATLCGEKIACIFLLRSGHSNTQSLKTGKVLPIECEYLLDILLHHPGGILGITKCH